MNTRLHFCDESRGEKKLAWRKAWLYSSVPDPQPGRQGEGAALLFQFGRIIQDYAPRPQKA